MNRRLFLGSATAGVWAGFAGAQGPAPLRVAVIGHTGRGNYGHGLDKMWQWLPETEVVAVADADPNGLKAAGMLLESARPFPDYRAMLEEIRPDIAAVCPRHPDQHRDMILAAIESGVRGIYCEKPFCRTLSEADEIVAAAERQNVKVAVAHRNVYHPVLPVLKQQLQEGLIGRVLEIRLRGKEDHRGGGEDLWVLGTHLFNLADFLEGPPLLGSARVLQNGKPVIKADVVEGPEGIGLLAGDEIHARFEMASGTSVFFDSILEAGTREAGFGVQIIGNQGIVDLRIDKDPLVHLLRGSPFKPTLPSREWLPVTTGGVDSPEPIEGLGRDLARHVVQGRDLIEAMRKDRDPLCDARAARRTIEMVAAVFESHRRGGAEVAIPLAERGNPLARL